MAVKISADKNAARGFLAAKNCIYWYLLIYLSPLETLPT